MQYKKYKPGPWEKGCAEYYIQIKISKAKKGIIKSFANDAFF